LDKAARPAAYIFNQTWLALHDQMVQGKITTKKPSIRFMNVGYEKSDEVMLDINYKNLGEMFKRSDMSSNILIIDEVIISGVSTKKAVDAILRAGYKPKSIGAIQQFSNCPNWYSHDGKKGTQDAKRFDNAKRRSFRSIPIEVRNRAWKISKILGVDMARLYLTRDPSCLLDYSQQEKMKAAGLDKLADNINFTEACRRNNLRVSEVLEHLRSHEGFTTVPVPKWSRDISDDFRGILKYMVEESIGRGLLKIENG